MKPRWTSYLLPVIAGCIGVVFCVAVMYNRSQKLALPIQTASAPQCAHWSIFRSAQLLGISTAPVSVERGDTGGM